MKSWLRQTRGLGVISGLRLSDGSRWGTYRGEPDKTPEQLVADERARIAAKQVTWLGGPDMPKSWGYRDWNPRTRAWDPGWKNRGKRK